MTPRRRFTISALILAGYAVILAALAGLGWVATDNVRQMQSITRDLYEHPFAVSHAAAEMKGALYQLRNHVLQMVLTRTAPGRMGAMCSEADAFDRTARADLAVIKASFHGDLGRMARLEAALGRWDAVRAAVLAAAAEGDYATAERLVKTESVERFAEIVPLLDYVEDQATARGRQFAELAERQSERIYLNTLGLVGLMMACVLAIAVAVTLRVGYLQRELDRQARVDYLTGIPNRRHFMEQAEHEFSRGLRYGTPLSLAIVDLDEFKGVNDRYGHPIGDQVLKRFCEVCRRELRHSDLLGRVGGEEFAMLLPNAKLSEAGEVIERIRQAVEASALATGEGELRFTASFGLAACSAGDADLSGLFRRADQALYEAKHNGRNRVCIQAA